MKRFLVRFVLPVLGVALLAAGTALVWHQREQRTTYYTDADTIRKHEEEAQIREILWQPAVTLPPWINTAREEYEPRSSDDGMTLFFARGDAGDNVDLFAAERTAGGWSEPRPLSAINTAADELGPEPTPDGRAVLLYSNRAGGYGGYDLWIAHRNDDGGWDAPVNLGPAVNSRYDEYGPSLDPRNPQLVYFVSNRPRPDALDVLPDDASATEVREDMAHRDYDIYVAVIGGDGPQPALPVAALNTEHDEGGPAVSPSGDFVYFSSNRPDGLGGFDVYRARRLRGDYLEPRNLGDTLNTEANELDPSVTMGGFGIHFSSDRAIDAETPEEVATYDLFFAQSREVFSETEAYRASIDWAGLWSDLWPYLLFLLLTLLLLLALMHAARRHKLSTMSLLARCILASLLAHLLLLAMFSLWEVTTTLADAIDEGKGMRVRLTSPSVGGRLASQVRSGLTDLEIRSDVLEESSRATEAVEASRADPTAVTAAASSAEQMEPASSSAVESRVADATARAQAAPAEATASVAPSAVSVDTPQPPTRVQVAASDAQPADAVSALAATRAANEAAGESSTVSASVAMSPAASDSAEATSSQMDDVSSDAQDAEPTTSQGRENTVPLRVVEGMDAIDLAMPTARQSPVDERSESESQVMAEVSENPRQTATSTRQPRPDDAPYVSRAPGRASPEQPSIAQAGGASARDASASPASEPAASSRTAEVLADLAADALSPVSPALETADASTAVEGGAEAPRLAKARRAASGVAAVATGTLDPTARLATDSAQSASDAPALRSGSLAADTAEDVGVPTSDVDSSTSTVDLPDLDIPMPTLADGGAPAATDDVVAVEDAVTAPRGGSTRVRAFAATSRAPAVSAPAGDVSSTREVMLADATLVAAADGPSAGGAPIPLPSGGELVVPSGVTSRLPTLEEAPESATVDAGQDGTTAAGPPRQKGMRMTTDELLADRGRGPSTLPVAVAPRAIDRPAERSLARRGSTRQDAVASERTPADLLAAAPTEFTPMMPLDVKLPEGRANPFPQRAPEKRQELLEKYGGSVETERAVEMALSWLARHQSDDGHWDGKDYDDGCGQCEGAGRMTSDIALTGMSLLCFLAADHSHVREGPYQEVVGDALDWLLARQGTDGSLMRDESMYSHGIATMALAEALGMTGDPRLTGAVQRAVDFIYEARNRRIGGWRYDPGQVGDTSVTGWQVMAMISARRAGREVSDQSLEVASAWLDLVSRRSRPGLYAYQPGKRFSPAMTAEGMYVRQLLGRSRSEPDMQAGAEYLLQHLPEWEDDANTYYWYYGTLALFQHGGDEWGQWNETVVRELLNRQAQQGLSVGSWPIEDQWSRIGGRVYQTAICCLTLEVYYRYLPLYVLEELADTE